MSEASDQKVERSTLAAIIQSTLQDDDVIWRCGAAECLVNTVGLYDRSDPSRNFSGQLLLGANITSKEDLDQAIAFAAARGAAALIVRGGDLLRPDGPFPVVGVVPNVPWVALLDSIRTLLALSYSEADQDDEALADLFALANAVSQQINAPVIIEDRSMRLLAFSEGQESADPSRVDTILRRRPSQSFMEYFQSTGMAGRLYAGNDPIYLERTVDLESEGLVSSVYRGSEDSYRERRLAIGVRAGARELGAIWVASEGEPDEEAAECMRLAAKVAALHILRMQAHLSKTRNLRSQALESVLWGSGDAASAWQTLKLDPRDDFVCVVGEACEGNDPNFYARLEALFTAHDATSVFGGTGRLTVGIVAPPAQTGDLRSVVRLLGRFEWEGKHLAFGLSDIAERDGLVRAREQAEHAFRVALSGDAGDEAVVFSSVQMTALLHLIASQPALYAEMVPAAPLRALVDYDARTGSDLVPTLRAYVETFGNISAAALRLHIHSNSLRYRISRILEITGLDFEEPDVVVELSLQLYLMRVLGAAAAVSSKEES